MISLEAAITCECALPNPLNTFEIKGSLISFLSNGTAFDFVWSLRRLIMREEEEQEWEWQVMEAIDYCRRCRC